MVAVRRVPKGQTVHAVSSDQIIAAAFAATEVRHPKIAAVLDAVDEPGEVAIVAEYVEGELLRSLQRRAGLRNEPIPDRIALRIGLDLAQAMEQARVLWTNVVQSARSEHAGSTAPHGGVAPDSILVAIYGELLILDLGVAAVLRTDRNLVAHPDVAGHCAPEQLDPAGHIDERSDVFSIAVIIWELLANLPLFGSPTWTRFVPHDGENPADSHAAAVIRRRVVEAPIARLDALVRANERVAKPIADVIAKGLSRKPSDRFSSLGEFRQALEALGAPLFATADEIRTWLSSVAGTSIQARQAALASIAGRSPEAHPFTDQAAPTLPPPIPAAAVQAVELRTADATSSTPPESSSAPESKAPKIKPAG